MVRSSNKPPAALVQRVANAVQLFQESTEDFDDAAAQLLGVNRTDLRCLAFVLRRGQLTAGELARQAKLTKGATTTALDRLESAGLLRRAPHPTDGRAVLVEGTRKAQDAVGRIWGPLAEAGTRMFAEMDAAQVEAIADFLEAARQVQLEHAERLLRSAVRRRPKESG